MDKSNNNTQSHETSVRDAEENLDLLLTKVDQLYDMARGLQNISRLRSGEPTPLVTPRLDRHQVNFTSLAETKRDLKEELQLCKMDHEIDLGKKSDSLNDIQYDEDVK
jgi:hypothetical protein